MEIVSPIDNDVAVVRLSGREIVLLANALNEAREAVEEWEFATRLGGTPAEAEALRRELRALLPARKA